MRVVSQAMTDAWKAEVRAGNERRPTVRATIQRANLSKFNYDVALAPGGDGSFAHQKGRAGTFTSIIFGDNSYPVEIRNIKEYSWSRSVDQDVAECSMTMLNTDLTPIGNADEVDEAGSLDQPGYMTFNRGDTRKSVNRWGYDTETGWNGLIVPDRLVKTYEGYGSDPTVTAAHDENLMQSGTWLVDDVTYTATGDIQLKMRDVGRLLLDQIVFPPVVPYNDYPLSWSKIRTEKVPGRTPTGGDWVIPRGTASSSNDKYVGKGLTNEPYPNYVNKYGVTNGHRPEDALDDFEWAGPDGENEIDYWESTGQSTRGSKVYWQLDFRNPTDLAGVRLQPHGGPYRVFVSVKTANGWVGKRKIPYEVTTGDVDIKAGIPFVGQELGQAGQQTDVVFGRKYSNVTAIRLTFTHLKDTGVGKYPWRAGLRALKVYAGDYAKLGFKKGTVKKTVGNYRDYTDIVKWVCAWGGLYWPAHSTGQDFIRTGGDDPAVTITYAQADARLPTGRAWGDFMQSGTAGENDLGLELFDKQPLMDVIAYVRDILGFLFFIDETGAAVWRLPNVGYNIDPGERLGNYLSPHHLAARTKARTADIITIDENDTLESYSTTLSSKNLRERVFVADVAGKIGTVAKGFVPYPVGLRRMAGWSDQNFDTKRETRVMADMIIAQQMFSYRRSNLTIPGYPAIQIDDQIRILERVTNETYYHYVEGVESSLNMETGDWTYTLTTHWLGEHPSDAWAVRVDELDDVTKAYLNAAGGV